MKPGGVQGFVLDFVLAKEVALFEALDVVIQASEVLYVLFEVKPEGGNEAKLGVMFLHSDIVVILDTIDVVPSVSELEIVFGGEVVVGSSMSLLECLIVGSVSCLAVELIVDSVVGSSRVVAPGTNT